MADRLVEPAEPVVGGRLAGVEVFKHLTREQLAEIEKTLNVVTVARGQVLIRQGEASDALFIVVSGRFRVHRGGHVRSIAEIGVGSPIGEIAFFAGGERTATVTAERDSLVLELKRDDFDRLATRMPAIWGTITSQLAHRLAETTAGSFKTGSTIPRTIAVCRAGGPAQRPDLVRQVVDGLCRAAGSRLSIRVLDEAAARAALPMGAALDADDATQWFNTLESRHDHVIYVADDELTPWSRKALRQADLVLCIGHHATGVAREPNLMEMFAERLHTAATLRLVLLHDGRPPFAGTRDWLGIRPWIGRHHHVSAGKGADYARIIRFIRGEALGLVACGGGAFCAAHIGIFDALAEAGLSFDAVGGTSGGAAMTAALALDVGPDEIERRTHEIFVARKAMRRWTWPRYSLLDHAEFDAALAEHFTTRDIEDLAIPFFAVATNLTTNATQRLESGPLWRAIRASAAIPALFPPVFTAKGDMLVDGCLLENVPLKTMLGFKTGPNVVIDFHAEAEDHCTLDSSTLPARRELLLAMMSGRGGHQLPQAPGPQTVLLRSLMMNRPDYSEEMDARDILLSPMIPAGIGHLDWHRHAELRAFGRSFAAGELARLRATGHDLLQDPAAP